MQYNTAPDDARTCVSSNSALTRRSLIGGIFCATLGSNLGGRLARGQATSAAAVAAPPLALTLSRFLGSVRFEDLPPVAVEHAKMLVASTLASAAPGSLIGSAKIVRELAKEHGGRAQATLWYDGTKLPITEAARVNAMQSDAAASDDSDLRNVAHTGTTVTATGLAVAEQTHASGRDLLTAMVTGYEAAGRIGEALVSQPGFHASIVVAFGGAVATARLLGLTDEQTAHAISLTATSMGGIGIGTNSWAREYHAGNAAMTAVNTALAAGRGFTANPDLLEARSGFFEVIGADDADPSSLVRGLGEQWDIVTHMAIKLVPGAHAFHPAVEAAVNAARQANVSPDDIADILVSGARLPSMRGAQPPRDLIEAIHSLPYFLASAVADRDFSWIHATPEKIASPGMLRLIGLVRSDPSPPDVDYAWSWGATVTLVTNSGRRFTNTVDAPRGSGPRGIEWDDVNAKYRVLMPDAGLPAARTERILETIHRLEELDDVTELTDLLAPN
ncbi:MAG TPA: MmgE/PrpD family protein [Gammaproteobacteria bacterium]|nr:MmgE/PrpD family protein [Gammaproteobacteria bacterium]